MGGGEVRKVKANCSSNGTNNYYSVNLEGKEQI